MSLYETVMMGVDSSERQLGLCRLWTDTAMDEIERWAYANQLRVIVEAREITTSTGVDHTFIRFVVELWPVFLFDGVGVENEPPYFGPEADAPAHLRNNHRDGMIMTLRKLKRNKVYW